MTFLAALALAFVPPALAGCTPTTSRPELTLGSCATSDAACFYVDHDLCHAAAERTCLSSIWIYQESNGIPGLQRGDEVHDDTCGGQIARDTLVW